MKVITFALGQQPCVMPVEQLVEILPARELLPMPPSEEDLPARTGVAPLGILDYRGKAVPVLKLRLSPADAANGVAPSGTGRRCLLVIGKPEGSGALAALEVGRVDAVVELDEGRIQPPEEIGLQGHPAVSGIYHLNNALAFVIDGPSLGALLTAAGGGRATTGASHG